MTIPNRHDPFREANWRHRRCIHLLNHHLRLSEQDDLPMHVGWQYVVAVSRCKNERGRARVRRRFPEIDAAHRLRFGSDDLTRWGVEGYMLAGVAPCEIDQRFRLITGTTERYCEHFFDIRHCLKASDYLINVVIRLHATRLTREDGERFIRLYGLMGGRFVVDALLDYYANPIPQFSDFEGAGEEERNQLRRRLEVHVALLLRCAREDSANLILFSLLMQKLDRHPREQASALIDRMPELRALLPDATRTRIKRKRSPLSKAA